MNHAEKDSSTFARHQIPRGFGVRPVLRRVEEHSNQSATAVPERSIAPAILIIVVILVSGCSLRRGTLDLTGGQSSVCGLHQETMSKQRVELDYGMKRDFESELDRARAEHFPNADEPFDTRNCLPSWERYARIWVCPRCTEAREIWLSAHSSISK